MIYITLAKSANNCRTNTVQIELYHIFHKIKPQTY